MMMMISEISRQIIYFGISMDYRDKLKTQDIGKKKINVVYESVTCPCQNL